MRKGNVLNLQTSEVRGVVLITVLTLFSISLLMTLRYDLSRSNMHYYDILGVAPYGLLATVSFYVFLVLSMVSVHSKNANQVIASALLAILSIMPYLAEIVANPQNILARDVYLHGHIRYLDSVGKMESLWYSYPKEYPGFFVLWYISYLILNQPDIRYVNLIILYPAMMTILTVSLLVLYRTVFGEQRVTLIISTLIAIALLMNNRSELTFQHANTRLYSLILLLMSLLTLVKIVRGFSTGFIASYVMFVSALSISHVLFPLVSLASLLLLWIMLSTLWRRSTMTGSTRLRVIRPVLFVVISIYFSWTLYNYYSFSVAKAGIKSFLDYYYFILGRELIVYSVTVRESLPWFGVFLRNIFKLTLVLLTFLAGMFVVSRVFLNKKTLYNIEPLFVWISYVGAIVVVFGLTIFTASLGNSINRGIMALAPLITPCAIAHLKKEISQKMGSLNTNVKAITLIFVIILCVNQFVLVHEEPIVISNTPPLDAMCLFLTGNKESYDTLVTSSPFLLYYNYYSPVPPPTRYTGDLGLVNSISEIANHYLSHDGIKIIDFRTIVYWSLRYETYLIGFMEWMKHVLSPLHASNSLIYNDGGHAWIFYDIQKYSQAGQI